MDGCVTDRRPRRIPGLRSCILLALWVLTVPAAGQALPAPYRISPHAKGYAQRYIEMVARSGPLEGAAWGVMAVTLSGDTLAQWNPYQKLVPASNMKLLTTGAALHQLGADYRLQTRIGYSGTIEGGVLKGDLYVIGGGDPTLGSKDTIAVSTWSLFAGWTQLLKTAGITRIDGRVIGDGRFFDGPIENDNWSYQDIGTYYGAGGNGLCFYRNILDVNVAPGAKAGDPVRVEYAYPEMPWMRFTQTCTTGRAGTGDHLYLFNSDLAPVAQMRGTFALDRRPKKEECSNKYGAYTCAYYFNKHLAERGIPTEGVADIDPAGLIRIDLGTGVTAGKAVPQKELTVLGSTPSPTLKQIASMTNRRSDNFYAETLFRLVGKIRKGTAVYDSCAVALTDVCKVLKVNTSYGIQVCDGSGLTRKNYVSPDFFCRFLAGMMSSPVFGDYVETLASPGSFHYAGRMTGEPQSIRERIFYKSGSMEGVRCFSGYIVPSDGGKEDTIVFSVMTNNCMAPNWSVYPILDRIIALLATEN